MKKPAIYVFSTAYDPFIGGAEIAVRQTAARLSDSFSFFIFTARMSSELPHVEIKDGITIIRVGFGSKLDKLLLIPLVPFEAFRWLREHPPALLWSVMISYAFPAAMMLKWWQGVPLLLTLQEGNREWEFQFKNLGMSWLGWRIALKNTDSLAAISTFLLQLSRSLGYRGEGVVIPNGVDTDRFGKTLVLRAKIRHELGIPPEAYLLITTSRLVEKNGVDIVLRAMARLLEGVRSKTHFLVVGGGPLEGSLKREAETLGIADHVHFIGEKSNEELPNLYGAADAFIRPSRSEGLGISFIEAMAAGLPVIGTRVGGIPDVIEDGETGLMAEPENAADVAKKIERLQQDPQFAKSIAEAGLRRAKDHFTWSAVTGAYQRLFLKIARKRSRILIASGIYSPDIGGTAKIASLLKQKLEQNNYQVFLIAYGELPSDEITRVTRALPTGLRHFLALLKAGPLVRKSDAVLLLDHFSIGFPTAIVARLLGRPYFVRIGGDFLWESSIESQRQPLTLPDFYRLRNWRLKERIIFYLSRWVLRGADKVIFTTSWQEQIFKAHYGISNTSVIENGAPEPVSAGTTKRSNEIIYAGRFIYLKNLTRLLSLFHEWKRGTKSSLRLRLIGDGPEEKRLHSLIKSHGMGSYATLEKPLEKSALMEAVRSARAVIVPSFSDVSPNLVLEALGAGTPAVLTQYSGFEFNEGDGVIRIDPMDPASFKSSFETLVSPRNYKVLSEAALRFKTLNSEANMSDLYEELLASLF